MEDLMLKDLYALMGASIASTAAEIRKAYRKMALRLHPDQNRDDPKAGEKFAELVSAYELLSDDKKREEYDAKIKLRLEREKKLKEQSALKQSQIRALLRREEEALQRQKQRNQQQQQEFAKKKVQSELERFREELKAMKAAASQAHEEESISRVPSPENFHRVSVKINRKRKPLPDFDQLRKTFSRYGQVQEVIPTKKKRRVVITFDSEDAVRKVMQPPEVDFLDGLGLSVSPSRRASEQIDSGVISDVPASDRPDSAAAAAGDAAAIDQGEIADLNVSPLSDPISPSRDMPFEDLEELVLSRLHTMAEKQRRRAQVDAAGPA